MSRRPHLDIDSVNSMLMLQLEEAEFRQKRLDRLNHALTEAFTHKSPTARHPPVITINSNQKLLEDQLTDQKLQFLRQKEKLERDLREDMEKLWAVRQQKIKNQLHVAHQEQTRKQLEEQKRHLKLEHTLQKEKLTRELKDQHRKLVDELTKQIANLKSQRIAQRILPELDGDSIIEAVELKEEPKLTERPMADQDSSFFMAIGRPSGNNTTILSQWSWLRDDRNQRTMRTFFEDKQNSQFKREIIPTTRLNTLRSPREREPLRSPEGFRDRNNSLLGPVPQVKIGLAWK